MKKIALFIVSLTILVSCSHAQTPIFEEKKPTHSVNEREKEKERTEKFVSIEEKQLENIQYEHNVKNFLSEHQYFDDVYSDIEGVLTFRGNHFRSSPSYGHIKSAKKLEELYHFATNTNPEWGGGAGWTGQASIIKWDKDIKKIMNIKEKFKEKEDFVEVVYASLDGNIYFFDLETGEKTRENISIENPIKGSLALDPRGYPLLYVGQGIPDTGDDKIGFRIFSLIDGKLLHFTKGITNFVHRGWGAFDGSALVNKNSDTLFIGGENGVFYQMKLNTNFNLEKETIEINPEEIQYRYLIDGNNYQGIENSVAIYKNIAYFADNGGSIQGVNTQTMKPVFALKATDDTDATLVIDEETNTPFLYTGTEIDKQGSKGDVLIRKIHGITGETVWKKSYPAYTVEGVNGGMLATPVVGKHELDNLVIFTIARYKTLHGGLIVALDKKTGEEVWIKEMPNYSWSSPVDVYTKEGVGYIIQGDSAGNLHVLNGLTGETVTNLPLGYNIEASPAVYNDTIIIATRGGLIHGIKIK